VSLLKRNNGFYFLCLYGFIAQHFSGKMSRLVLICAPITSIACAIWCGFVLDMILEPFLLLLGKRGYTGKRISNGESKDANESVASGKKSKNKKVAKSSASQQLIQPAEYEEDYRPGGVAELKRIVKTSIQSSIPEAVQDKYHQARVQLDSQPFLLLLRGLISIAIVFYVYSLSGIMPKVETFVKHSNSIAHSLSSPKVVFTAQDRVKGVIKVTDYYDGYKWIDANTPKDSRVMAWWDYGYQITGIAKRTSIADGNTWNHEHIATLGRTMTSPEKKAWNAIRHLADYVLVWAGGRGDDLGKSPHLARIGNSVFPEHCGDDDPKCQKFGFYQGGEPTPMMKNCLLYKAVMHNMKAGVKLNPKMFKEVHTTKNGLLRVYQVMNVSQESKQWIADPKNRICDAPGSWYCVGQYPPALEKLIAKRRNFAQVEDFNKKGEQSAYTKLIEKERRGEL